MLEGGKRSTKRSFSGATLKHEYEQDGVIEEIIVSVFEFFNLHLKKAPGRTFAAHNPCSF